MNSLAAGRALLAGVAAAVFAIAAVAAGPPSTRPGVTRPTTTPPTRVLIVAGGTSHDFKRWFEDFDAALLRRAGCTVAVTEEPAVAADQLPQVDVALVSTNKAGFDTPAFRAALFAFVDAGHAPSCCTRPPGTTTPPGPPTTPNWSAAAPTATTRSPRSRSPSSAPTTRSWPACRRSST